MCQDEDDISELPLHLIAETSTKLLYINKGRYTYVVRLVLSEGVSETDVRDSGIGIY